MTFLNKDTFTVNNRLGLYRVCYLCDPKVQILNNGWKNVYLIVYIKQAIIYVIPFVVKTVKKL